MKSIELLKTAIDQLQKGERTCIGCVVRQVEKEVKSLEFELNQQRFNNKHNLSIDQTIADKIESLEKEKKQYYDDAFAFSAELTYKDRLIKEYELLIPKVKQREVKRHIFSEDDR